MQESKSIITRWQEAKEAVIRERARLTEIAAAVGEDVKNACGQEPMRDPILQVGEFAFVLEWYRGSRRVSCLIAAYGNWWIAPSDHWSISLCRCEKMAAAAATITAEQLRLAYEASLA